MSEALAAPPAPARRAAPATAAPSPRRGLVLLPVAVALAYALLLALRMRGISLAVLANSDALNSPLIGDSLGQGRAGRIWLPGDTFVNAVWFDAATRWLPGHRALWEWWPYALSLLAAVAVAASVRRVAGRIAAAIALAVGVAAPPIVLVNLIPQNFHVTTVATTALLGWFAATAAAGGLPGRRLWLVGLGLGLVAGVDTASDPLLAVCGLAPLFGAALLARQRDGDAGRRVLAGAIPLAAAAAVAIAVTAALTAASGISVLPAEGDGVHLAGPGRIGTNLDLAGAGLSRVAIGPLLGRDAGAGSPWAWAAGLLLLGGALVLAGLAIRALTAPAGRHPGGAARRTHVAFWTLVAVLSLGAFLLTTIPAGDNAVRYLVPLFYAAAALLPLAAAGAGRLRGLVAAGVAAWVGVSAAGLALVPASAYDSGPAAADLEALVPYLEAHGLTRGYASFWDANALTWASDSRIEVRPVMRGAPCGDPGGASLCAYHFNSADGWYDPRPVERSFLLVHPGAACVGGPPDPSAAPVIERHRVGSTEVLVVAGDLAAHLVPSRFALCPPG